MEKVVNIQRKWRSLSTKKIFFKMMIRNLWKEKFPQCYLTLKLEKRTRENEPLSPIARSANTLLLNKRFNFKLIYF
jgi:hypothetical protein